jgi:hypothetical protein
MDPNILQHQAPMLVATHAGPKRAAIWVVALAVAIAALGPGDVWRVLFMRTSDLVQRLPRQLRRSGGSPWTKPSPPGVRSLIVAERQSGFFPTRL